jgi:hypothetical protein
MHHTSHHTCQCPPNLISLRRVVLLPIILDVGFQPARHHSDLHFNHPSHCEWVFKVAFSSNNDEVIADAVNAWIVGGDQTPPGSFASYFAKRVEKSRPFSPRLQQVTMHAIGLIQHNVLEVSGLETVHLLNCLDIGFDDMEEKDKWVELLVGVICLPAGLESLSPHYWCLLDKLALSTDFFSIPGLQIVEVMRSLKEAEDWGKLEVWMTVVWQSLPKSTPVPTMEDVKQVTLNLLLQQPSALQRFKDLCQWGSLYRLHKAKLQQVCDQVQTEQQPSESPLPL